MEDIEYSDFSEVKRFHISRRDLEIWIISAIASVIWGYIQGTAEYWESIVIAPFVNAMNTISFAITLGIPIFFAAGLIFASPYSRAHMLDLKEGGWSSSKILLQRSISLFILLSLYSLAMVLATFIEPVIRAIQFDIPINLSHFLFLPAALVSTIAVITLLGVIGVFLALGTDNRFLSTILGCSIVVVLALVTGWSVLGMGHTASRAIALLSPHNLVRGLAALLSGYQFESQQQMIRYLGFSITTETIVFALFMFSILSLCALGCGIPILKKNLNRWSILLERVEERTIWERQQQVKLGVIKRSIRTDQIQKVLIILIVFLTLSTLSVGGNAITSALRNEAFHVHYQSEDSGDVLPLDTWFFVEFTIIPSSIRLGLEVWYDVNINNWMDCPEPIKFQHALLNISQVDFELMDEINQVALCEESSNRTRDGSYGISEEKYIGSEIQSYLLVFRIVTVQDDAGTGQMLIDLTVLQMIA